MSFSNNSIIWNLKKERKFRTNHYRYYVQFIIVIYIIPKVSTKTSFEK
jgi:hypothetical protein